METLQTILLVLQVLLAVTLIGLILIQHGKGADAGAAFGSGASNTVFGAQGSGNFLTKTTAILAFAFLANSIALVYIANQRIQTVNTSLMDETSAIMEQMAEPPSSVINEIPADTDSGVSEIPEMPE
jgi:preprotein translocase subunit SecG